MHQPEARIFPTAGQAPYHRRDDIYAPEGSDALERRERHHSQSPDKITIEKTVRGIRHRHSNSFCIRLRQDAPKREQEKRYQQDGCKL